MKIMARKMHPLQPIFLVIFILFFSAVAGFVVVNGTISVLFGHEVGFGSEMMILLPIIGALGGFALGLILHILDPLFQKWRIIALAVVWAVGLWAWNLTYCISPLIGLVVTLELMRTSRQQKVILVCLLLVFGVIFLEALSPLLNSWDDSSTYETTITVSPLLGMVVGLICAIILIVTLGLEEIFDPDAEE